MEIKKIGIVGQGALGVMYGNYLKKRMGNENVFFIADEGRGGRLGYGGGFYDRTLKLLRKGTAPS